MSDIKAGDVVVCVDASPYPSNAEPTGLRVGRAYRVRRVVGTGISHPRAPLVRLCEKTATPSDGGWSHVRFRKIDKTDEQFTEQVKACRPIKTRERA